MAALARTLGIFGAFVAVVGAAFYPIYFRPLLLPEEYKKEQSINRAGIVQEDIQPAELYMFVIVITNFFRCRKARWMVNSKYTFSP